ncbi:MAG: hypothetical protein ACRDEB_07490, partial [Chitinophagaceae bacterium]
MHKNHLFAAPSLFLLLTASIIRAQTISSQKGLTTAVFPTQYGNVKVYLPHDIRPGDMISGTVVAEPDGRNARQTEKNLAELLKYTINIDGNKCPVTDKPSAFKWLVQLDRQVSAPIELLNVSGFKAHELKYQFISPVIGTDPIDYGCVIPSHALTASPLRIQGNFDGDMANTQCLLNNQPTQILAESPRQCQVQIPEKATGQQNMQVNENGQEKCTRQISGVDMLVTAGDLNLRKGQNTYIDVKVTGLQNLPDKAVLTITNTTPNIVTMTNGNVQVIPIWPPPDSAAGTFSVHCPAVSISTGNFSVNINLDLPDVMLSPGPGDNKKSKCNCSVTATIIKPTTINFRGFHATLQKICGGQNCSEASVTRKWEIVSGRENIESADISNDNESINVQPKGEGPFTLKFSATLTCSDGSSCTTVKFINEKGDDVPPASVEIKPNEPKIPVTEIPKIPTTDSIPTTTQKVCLPDVVEKPDPKMVGGLKNKQTGTSTTSTIFRDDFIALEATGSDVDLVTFKCNPQAPCPDSKSEKTIPVTGKVRFEWAITGGEGRFVKLGCGAEDEKTDKGEHIIFQPLYVPLPKKNADTTFITTILLSIIDDGSPVIDPTVTKTITIKTIRKKAFPDRYDIIITGGEPDKPATPA